jgi:hypothetical protein
MSSLASELAAAGFACTIADGLFHPLDTLKIRRHAGTPPASLLDLWSAGLAATGARACT